MTSGYAEFHYEIEGVHYVTRIFPSSEGSYMHTRADETKWTSAIAPGPSINATLGEIKELVRAELAAA